MKNAAGSAMQEMDNIEQSLEYKLNALKETAVGIFQNLIPRDVIAGVTDFVTSFLELIDALIEKFGALPTISGLFATGFSIFGNKGVFSTINSDLTSLTSKLGIFGKSLSNIFSDLKSGHGLYSFTSLIDKKDVGYITQYINQINSGVDANVAWKNSMQNASAAGKEMATKIQVGTASLSDLNKGINMSKIAMIGLKVTTVALNMALTMGIVAAIQAVVLGINNLIHAEKNAFNSAKEAADISKEKSDKYKEEYKSISELIEQYKKLAQSDTIDESTRSEILDIQTQITDLVGSQAGNLDLVNGNLDTELSKLREIQKLAAQQTFDSSVASYHDAKNKNKEAIGSDSYAFRDGYAYVSNGWWNTEDDEILNIIKDAGFAGNITKGGIFNSKLFVTDDFDNELNKLDTASQKLEFLQKIIDEIQSKSSNYAQSDLWSGLVEQRDAYKNIVEGQEKEAQKLLDSALILESYDATLGNIVVNSADTFNEYRNKLVNNIMSNDGLSEAIADGLIDEEKVGSVVENYMSTLDGFSRYYDAWRNKFSTNTSSDNSIGFIDKTLTNLEDKVNAVKNLFNKLDSDMSVDFSESTSEVNNFNKWVDSLNDEGKEILYEIAIKADDTSKWTLTTWQEEFNKVKSGANETTEALSRFYSLMNDEKEGNFSEQLTSYSKSLSSLKDVYSKVDLGTLTNDEKLEIAINYPELSPYINDTELLKDALSGLIDTTNSNIDSAIEAQIESLGLEGTAAADALRNLKDTLLGLTDGFEFNIDREIEKFNNLYEAVKQSVSATGLNSESIEKLNAMYADLDSYNPAELFERTENGIHLNTVALRKLQSEYESKKHKEFSDELNRLKDTYDGLTDEINKAGNASNKALLLNERDKIADQINKVADLATQYDGLTSAYNKWIQAQSSGNERDLYEGIINGKEEIDDLIKRGWGNSEVVRNYVDLLSYTDLSVASAEEVEEAYKKLGETIGNSGYSLFDFMTVNDDGESTSDGIFNFFDTVKSELGEVYAYIDESGKYHFDFGNGKDIEVAKKLGMNVEFLQSILRAASEAGFEVNLDSVYSQFRNLENTLDDAVSKLKELKRSGKIDFDISEINLDVTTVKDAQQEIDKVQEVFNTFVNSDGTVNVDAEGFEEVQTVLISLISKKQELEIPAIMSVDTSRATSKVEEAIKLLQNLQTNYNDLEIQTAIGADTTEAQTNIQNTLRELNSLDKEVKAKLGLDSTDFQEAINTLASETNVPANITVGEESLNTVVSTIQAITPEMIVNAGVDPTLVDEYTPADKESTVVFKVDSTLVDKYKPNNKYADAVYTPKLNSYTLPALYGNYYVTPKVAEAQGTAHANGTAFAKGSWGTKSSGVALGGELGQEIVVRNGEFFTIGDNGAEFFHYKKNDIIFNHKQSEEILKYGKILSGNKRGKALAYGTAFSSGSGAKRPTNTGGKSITTYQKEKESEKKKKSSSSKKSSSKSSAKETAEEFEEIFDWIEIAIERVERAISRLDLKASSVFKSWTSRNTALQKEITYVTKEIKLQENAYDRYLKQANSVGLSSTWKNKVKNGSVDISTIKDEKLAEKIQDYQEWYNKALDCKDAIDQLNESLSELYQQRFDNVVSKFDGILTQIENEKTLLEQYITQSEEQGYITSVKYYKALINNEQKNIQKLQSEREQMMKALQEAVDSGTIKKGSEAWYSMKNQIDEVAISIEEANTAVIEFNNSIRDIEWEIFDKLQEKISYLTQEADFLITLMENDKLYNNDGSLTDSGTATMGLHAQNYNVYMAQADKYAEEIKKIDKELADDSSNQELAQRRQELLELQQEMILAAEDEKEAIRDMVSEGIELELDAISDLIKKYEDALDVQKDLYDYNKKVKEQTAEIASLQKQLSAYANDTSEETKAKVQELKVSLENAESNLEETQYEKYVSDQKRLLDELYNEYEQILNERLDNIDALLENVIAEVNASSSSINQTLSEKADSVGYTLSDEMSNIWNSDSGVNQVVSVYGDKMSEGITAVNNTLNNIYVTLQGMISEENKKATETIKNGNNSSKKTSTSSSTTSKKSTTTKSSSSKSSTSKSSTSKSDKQYYGVALAVWNGDYGWGDGDVRKSRLKKKGFDSSKVQSIINKMEKDGYIHNGSWKGKYYDIKDLSPYHYNKFILGTRNVKSDQMAWTQEHGNLEAIIRPSDGAILTPLARNDSVLNNAATSNLFDFANDPEKFIRDNLSELQSYTSSIPSTNTLNNSTVNLENVNFNLPNVQNYQELFYELQHDKRFEKLIQAMTTDRLRGGSSLKKYRI